MAIVSAKEAHPQRSGDLPVGDGGSLTRHFIVVTNSKLDGSLVVTTAAGIPAYGAAYSAGGSESSANWICKRKTGRQRQESPLVWDVEVVYEPMTIDGEGEDGFDPTSQPTDYQWKTIQESREMPVDAYGVKSQTTAGEPFEDAPEAERSYRSLVITRNIASFSAADYDPYVNTLNSTPIFGYAANEGRIVAIDASGEFDKNFGGYWQQTIEIHFRITSVWAPTVDSGKILPNGTYPAGITAVTSIGPWDIVRRNSGTMAKKEAADVVAEPIVGDNGHQFSNLYDIAPNGTRRTESLGDPYYLVLRPYLPVSWAPLNL